MDFIKKRAENFAKQYIDNQVDEHETVVDEAQMELSKIRNPLDKITFLRVILELNERQYQNHLLVCRNKNNCPENDSHEAIHYYLTGELEDLGIHLNEDQFTKEEQLTAESKLDQVLKELETVKFGHQVIYDDLMKEIQELKDFYILGKKKWYQLFLGKTTEMVLGGVISETVSKELVSVMGNVFQKAIS
ncbi:hypothetical protein ASU31_10700 [Pedobacter ginsenosidimutans]|uniref:Uncharacterized protein n=1 Tax=Pedobacter ginsenosidimutans TaxID=687842 RepID=A0A0T5VQ35_9SPHI|nr:hypothetical protein [Pedobacter ginsenosidimutans]KRT15969.1 hypothetical protein ASU31_10700 [Pedobacter ginsenosidimutans]